MVFIATVWNNRSEHPYTFGPFHHSELDAFEKKVFEDKHYNFESLEFEVMNPPKLFATGDERG
jgi:hypothetical protein